MSVHYQTVLVHLIMFFGYVYLFSPLVNRDEASTSILMYDTEDAPSPEASARHIVHCIECSHVECNGITYA